MLTSVMQSLSKTVVNAARSVKYGVNIISDPFSANDDDGYMPKKYSFVPSTARTAASVHEDESEKSVPGEAISGTPYAGTSHCRPV